MTYYSEPRYGVPCCWAFRATWHSSAAAPFRVRTILPSPPEPVVFGELTEVHVRRRPLAPLTRQSARARLHGASCTSDVPTTRSIKNASMAKGPIPCPRGDTPWATRTNAARKVSLFVTTARHLRWKPPCFRSQWTAPIGFGSPYAPNSPFDIRLSGIPLGPLMPAWPGGDPTSRRPQALSSSPSPSCSRPTVGVGARPLAR